ncbi:hypothetical protein ABBQ32_008826 [Trebouxia sp. C0010 RCD-2024]
MPANRSDCTFGAEPIQAAGSPSYAHVTHSDPPAMPAGSLPGPPANSGSRPLATTATPAPGPSSVPASAPSASTPQ